MIVQGRSLTGALVPVTVGLIRTSIGERVAVQAGDGDAVLLTDQGVAQLIANAREALAAKSEVDPR